jgi:hypothetical protein
MQVKCRKWRFTCLFLRSWEKSLYIIARCAKINLIMIKEVEIGMYKDYKNEDSISETSGWR